MNGSNAETAAPATAWWERAGLCHEDGRLTLADRDVASLAEASGTPSFFYDAERVRTKVRSLHEALDGVGLPHRVFYAIKANRFVPLVCFLRETGLAGIDACSPNELLLALECGFEEADVSYTATSVSEADLDVLTRHPRVHVNCDSVSTIRRLGARCPGRTIGLRVNPGIGLSYGDNALLQYAGTRTTKFGIYREHLEEALATAAAHDLTVDTIHFHVGIGYLTGKLPVFESVLAECETFLEAVPGLRRVNIGGGLGVPHRVGDEPLDLHAWAAVLARRYGGRGIEVCVEPGDFVVKDSGVLVLRVVSVERKRDTVFVGVDGGFNLAVEPTFYGLPCEPTAVVLDGRPTERVSIAGNINEALDVWAEDVELPMPEEGELLAFLNAGGYASAMASNHCMRGTFRERLLR